MTRRRLEGWTPSAQPDAPLAPVPSGRPLLVSVDDGLLDDIARLAAAAGTELDVVPDLLAAEAAWRDAVLILVDARCVGPRVRLPRRFDVLLVTRGEPSADVWPQALQIGAEHVVSLPLAEPWLVERLAAAADGGHRGVVVAVTGVRGGLGATTLACGLAVTAARLGLTCTLVDADPSSGGIDMLFGGEEARGARWPDLLDAEGPIPSTGLREMLPRWGRLALLSQSRTAPVAVPTRGSAEVFRALRRCNDLVVVDVPRTTFLEHQDIPLRAVVDLGVVLVSTDLRGAALARIISASAPLRRIWYLRRRSPGAGTATTQDDLELPWVGELRSEPGLARAAERGEAPAGRGVGPLARLCERLVDRIVCEVTPLGDAISRFPSAAPPPGPAAGDPVRRAM